jgi:hypothetical protein
MKLGQPVPTLSGGEAQRLKLAGHLAKAGGQAKQPARTLLFLFDEPTTGLHFDDIARTAARPSAACWTEGHSLLVIEHNLDVMRAADWLIDLGPEGGDGGGELVCEGTPEQVMAVDPSHTGGPCAKAEAARRHRGVVARAYPKGRPKVADAVPRATPSPSPTPGSTTSRASTSHPRDKLHGDHRPVRLGQEHRGLRHPVQRGPAPLPGIAERLRPPVRAAGLAAPTWTPFGHPAHGGHRAAHQPRRPQEHRGHHHRGAPLPAPAVREAGHPVLPRLRRAHRAPDPEAILARCCREGPGGGTAAPLVWRARAITRIWPAGPPARAFESCGWTAKPPPPTTGRAWTATGTRHRTAGGEPQGDAQGGG